MWAFQCTDCLKNILHIEVYIGDLAERYWGTFEFPRFMFLSEANMCALSISFVNLASSYIWLSLKNWSKGVWVVNEIQFNQVTSIGKLKRMNEWWHKNIFHSVITSFDHEFSEGCLATISITVFQTTVASVSKSDILADLEIQSRTVNTWYNNSYDHKCEDIGPKHRTFIQPNKTDNVNIPTPFTQQRYCTVINVSVSL